VSFIINELASIVGLAALGLPPHAILEPGMGQALKHSLIKKLNNNFVFYALQGVIKMVRRGAGGVPRTPFQRDAALPGHEMRP
jgi:hypothetical protein